MICVDPISKAKSGCLYNAVVYRRRKNRRTRQSIVNISVAELSEQQKDEIKQFFKTCRLPESKESVKMTMTQYKDYRMDLIQNSFEEYKEIWSFYFVCLELVRAMFAISVHSYLFLTQYFCRYFLITTLCLVPHTQTI